jgi:subtilisin family serine protease
MKTRLLVILCLIAGTIASAHSDDRQTQSAESIALAKLAPWVVEHTQNGKQAEFLVVLADQADLSGASRLQTKEEKGRFVYHALWNKAQDTQKSLLSWLVAARVEHRSYYLVNMIWVRGNLDVAMSIAAREDVARIEGNPEIHNNIEERVPADQTSQQPDAIEPGITNTRAPEVWALGYTGQGVVLAGADTGYRWTHVAIKPHYRGWNGTTASHDYNWHDSIHTGGGSCGANSLQPCDDDGHGTHTMGTATGDDGAGNQVGMAPGAKWIGCRNMDQGDGTPARYIECMEFFLAPYPVSGTPAQGDPSKAPHITTNSWGCPPSEGCSPASLQQAVEAQRAAGIMMVVAAGNAGSGCSSVNEPPAIYDANYSIGAFSSSTNIIASFSSRGPVTIDGSNRLKPDISAPGVSVRSSYGSGDTVFTSLSGTSMATPHVAGAVALLWSAQPGIRGNVSFAEQILNAAAVHVSSTACSSSGVPNNTYGYGRLDIKAAVDAALPCTSAPTISSSSASFAANGGSGTFNVTSVGTCGWIAESSASWLTITAGSAGTGNGSVSYSVAPNLTAAIRNATLVVGGQTFTVYQGVNYNDVPIGSLFYDEIGKLSARGITVGCGGGNYCPNDPVTRQEMAAFIMRSKGEFNPPMPLSQRFTDVPAGNTFYNFIDRLAVLGITQGCNPPTNTMYCPGSAVTREQMAAFLIRGLGEFSPPDPASQRFNDVPPANVFYNFIDRLAALNITLGCTPDHMFYCPGNAVTRGEMAAFLVRAFNL